MSAIGKIGVFGRWFAAASMAAVLIVAPVHAQDAPKKEEAKKEEPKSAGTIADPAIDIGDLKLMLEPLTKAELEVEANGWWKLLQGKVREVSEAELAVRRRNREIAALDKVKAAAENVAAAAARADKQPAAAATEAEKAAAAKLERAKAELERASAAPAKTEAAGGDKPAASSDNVPGASDQAILDKAVQTAAKQAERTGDEKQVADRAEAAARESQAAQAVASAAQVPVAGQAPAAAAPAAPAAQKAETIAASVQEAAAAKTEVKVQLIDFATQLGNERTQITDRLKVVLDEWDRKGGESKDIRQYIAAVGGLKVDVTDASSTLTRIKAWMMTDEGGLRMARNLALFMTYLAASFVLAWLVRALIGRMLARMRHGPSQLLRKFILDMSGRLVIFFGILAGLSALEINLSPLLAIIGASGFVVAFALQGTLSNFASGLLIMINKPFDVGDEVDVGGGIEGRVEELNIFSTLIRTTEGIKKIVPNNTIWNGVIVNRTTGVVTPPPNAATA
ncbi:MAG: mechanosensitive ion channel family protein [Beijerinckiaceae bacterium]